MKRIPYEGAICEAIRRGARTVREIHHFTYWHGIGGTQSEIGSSLGRMVQRGILEKETASRRYKIVGGPS